jgi:5'(3')-deoxyribonucleotidase
VTLTIAVDVDSVLNNLCDVWYDAYNKATGDTLRAADVKGWNTHEYAKFGDQIYDYLTADVVAACTPTEGAQDALKSLVEKHNIVIVTAVWPGTYDVKMKWLSTHFPYIKHIVCTSSKHFVQADVLIDDGMHNLAGFSGLYPVCFDQPWNQEWKDIRVKSWFEIPALIEQLEKELDDIGRW